jgi:hypothetical protein
MTQGRVIRPPLFLHKIPTWLGRHIYIYAGTLQIYPGRTSIPKYWPGYGLYAGLAETPICRPGRDSYMPARPNLGQPLQSQPLSLHLSSLLTLPGVIPPTLVPEVVEVP